MSPRRRTNHRVTTEVARTLVWLALAYVTVGAVFAIVFALRGAGVLDPVARQGTWGFRLLIVPGAMTLWPFLLLRWIRGRP